jgi:transposase
MKLFRKQPLPDSQMFLLPQSVGDFVGEDEPVRILSEVIDSLDLHELYARYNGGGAPAYDPRMLLKVLLFALQQGMRSSRKIAATLKYDLRFMFLSNMSHPCFRTLCGFRKDNEKAIAALFVEVVRLCQTMGLVLLEEAAVDGTKIQANVSRKHTYKAERLDHT